MKTRLMKLGSTIVVAVCVLVLTPGNQVGASSAAFCGGVPVTAWLDTPGSLEGTDGRDVLRGSPGDDVIYGRGDRDIICGGGGNDQIFSGAGDDYVYDVEGDNVIVAGLGDDEIYFSGFADDGDGHDTVVVFAGSVDSSSRDDKVIYAGAATETPGDSGNDGCGDEPANTPTSGEALVPREAID